MKNIKIIVNAEEHWTDVKAVSYEQIVGLAQMPDQSRVTYIKPRHSDAQRTGKLHPGGPDVEIENGMEFRVAYTGNA